jgi:hypothetical protein
MKPSRDWSKALDMVDARWMSGGDKCCLCCGWREMSLMWWYAACGVTGVCVVKRLKGFSCSATVCGLGESSDCVTPLETTNPNPPKSKHGQNTVRHVKHLPFDAGTSVPTSQCRFGGDYRATRRTISSQERIGSMVLVRLTEFSSIRLIPHLLELLQRSSSRVRSCREIVRQVVYPT